MQNMFKTKPISSNVTTPKLPKLGNVPVNMIVAIITHNQQPKHVLKERESVKAKGTEDWQQEERL